MTRLIDADAVKARTNKWFGRDVVFVSHIDHIATENAVAMDKHRQIINDMNKIINRLYRELDNVHYELELVKQEGKAWHDKYKELLADRQTGEWIEKNSHTYICDHCGFEQAIYGNLDEYNYCPHCRAKMKGGGEK